MFINSLPAQTMMRNKPAFKSINHRVVMDPKYANDHILVNCDVKKVDKLLSEDKFCYVGKNGKNGIQSKYINAKEYILSGKQIFAPVLEFCEEAGKITTGFWDGRHRFAVIRDLGISEFPLAIQKNALEMAKSLNIIR